MSSFDHSARSSGSSSRWQQFRKSDLYDPLEHDADEQCTDSGQVLTVSSGSVSIDTSAAKIVADAAARLARQLQEQQAATLENYVPATDPQFNERLSRALQKNFSYIRRKDEAIAQHLLAGGDIASFVAPSASSGVRKFQKNLPISASKAGIGVPKAKQPDKPQSVDECTRVYVSGLPIDISEEEIDILFSPQGKIRRIKLYTNADGSKKGDALITFFKAESAVSSCLKLNTLDIGEGHILNVSMADFSASNSAKQSSVCGSNLNEQSVMQSSYSDETLHVGLGSHGRNDQNASSGTFVSAEESCSARSVWEQLQNLRCILPTELEADSYPVVMILNTHDTDEQASDPDALIELQTDMLEECCKYGNVKAVDLITVSDEAIMKTAKIMKAFDGKPSDLKDSLLPKTFPPPAAIAAGTFVDGAVVAAYENYSDAYECSLAVNGRWFGGRQLWVILLPSSTDIATILETKGSAAQPASHVPPPPRPPPFPPPTDMVARPESYSEVSKHNSDDAEQEACEKAANDVEDFLNSLLDT